MYLFYCKIANGMNYLFGGVEIWTPLNEKYNNLSLGQNTPTKSFGVRKVFFF